MEIPEVKLQSKVLGLVLKLCLLECSLFWF